MEKKRAKPVILAILDGWGESASHEQNAVAQASTPHFDALKRDFPHGVINASEGHVGLPAGQMGNSEVGHMNIGAGRVVMQDLPRIDAAVADGSLARHPELARFIEALRKSGGACHLMGLLSPGGVHSHQSHLAALARIVAAAGVPVRIHAFLDGRDTPPKSALGYLEEFEREIAGSGAQFATLSGRYYAMDRDKRWERVEKAYQTLAEARGDRHDSPAQAVEKYYAAGTTDEFIPPAVIGDYAGMRNGDGLLVANFRADRVRQLLLSLLDPGFSGFSRGRPPAFAAALGMAEYSSQLSHWMRAIFPPEALVRTLGEVVAEAGLSQLRIAETEKYAHVTFFFNGGREEVYAGEERILIPSPKVATYDLKPEMSAYEVTEAIEKAVAEGRFDLIVVNYANTDMVGHTGNLAAAMQAVEAVDACLGRIAQAALAQGGAIVVTADHGNAESMFDEATGQSHTAHTLNLVPFIIAQERYRGRAGGLPEGRLADVAPTVLALMGLPVPPEMTGRALLPHAA